MGINIGNNNKEQEENKFFQIFIELSIAILSGLVVGFCIYKFGWNK